MRVMLTPELITYGKIAGMRKYARPRPETARPPHYLREWRQYRGLTQARLGERLNMDKGSVSRLENFETKYTQETLEAFGVALGVEAADLLQPPPSPDRPEDDLTRHLRKLKTKEDRAKVARLLAALFEEKFG